MSDQGFLGVDPNALKLLISSDPTTNSETLLANTKCIWNALKGIKTISVPDQEGSSGKYLGTDGEGLQWSGGDWVKSINGATPDENGEIKIEIPIPERHTLGDEWVSYVGAIPDGGVPYLGQEVSREMYPDLYEYARRKGLMKSEDEWQTCYRDQNGNVPFYSELYGADTFRMPLISSYPKPCDSVDACGTYVSEGLPNIAGTFALDDYLSSRTDYATGPFYDTGINSQGAAGNGAARICGFDASRYNPIYGNSVHVVPNSVQVLWGVYAYGAVPTTTEIDVSEVINELTRIQANALTKDTLYVTESFFDTNSYNWYKKYSNGWLEQGGYIENTKSGLVERVETINLLIPFKTNVYHLQTSINNGTCRTDGYAFWRGSIAAQTATTFNINLDDTNVYFVGVWWTAYGYGS